ncbi:uncharacterized protein zbbx [Lycodopsis pacificus]
MQVLQMETVTLGQESTEMEQKLQQLKESMSKEKEERGHSGGFRWKSGQRGSLNSNALTSGVKKKKEDILQKLSAGKVKIRVLKDEPLTAPPPPPPPPREKRKNRLKGTRCGQCEIKTAGLMCAECTEHYCIGCFTKFHQKGALKLHRMIPIQTDLQTHVSTRDVVSCFQKQTDPRSHPITSTSHAAEKPVQLNPDPSQVLTGDHGDEEKSETIEEGQNMSFLKGDYNEVESVRSFQEALRQWRGEKSDGSGEPTSEGAMWTPIQPVSVSVMATQADLSPDRGGGEGRVPVRVEFTENSLTYGDRLHLKKHRRTPVETYRPLLACGTDLKSMPKANTGEETASSLTAQEEDFRHYCASLFAVPVSRGTTEPQITTPESCLVIEVLHERDRDINGVVVAERRTDNNRKVPSVEPVLIKGELLPQTALTTGSSRVRCSSPSPAPASRPSRAPAQPKAAQKLHLSKPQTSQAEHSITLSPLAPTRPTIPEVHLSPSTSISFPLRSTFTVSPSSSTESTLLPKLLAVIKDSPLAVKMEEEGERSIDSGDEMSTDSLGLAPHEEDSSDEEAELHGRLARGGSRDEQGNPAIPHSEDPFVPADAEREKDLQTHEEEQLSNPSMVMHNQSAGPRSEQFCDPDGFPPLGLDMNSDTPEHTHCDPLLTGQTSPHVSDPSDGYRPSSSLRTHTEEHLVFRMMRNNRMQPTANQIHSTRPTSRGQISVNRRGTSELGPGFRPLSRAAMEIMEICNVDHTGCEDPDLESDTAAHALHGLEQELRLMAKETWKQASLLGTGDRGGQDQHGNYRCTRSRASDEQNDEEEAATQRDRLSVLLLP